MREARRGQNRGTARFAAFILVIGCAAWLVGCARQRDPILAKVQNIPIRYSDVVWELQDHGRLKPGESPTCEQVRQILDRLVERKLKYLEGLRRGYDNAPDIAPYIEALRKDLSYKLYRQEQVINKLITEKDVRDFYRLYGQRVKIRHILIRVPEDATQEQIDEARDRIEDIRMQILAGVSFAEMAKRYSDEAQTASRGGEWGYIRRGTGRFDDIFYDVAFSLKEGELSKPFRTRVGWHLLLCEGHEKPSRQDYEARKESIRNELIRQRAEEIDSAMYALRDRLFERYNVRVNDEGVARLNERIHAVERDTSARAPQLRRITRGRQFEQVRPEDRPVVLCEWDGGKYTIGDLVDEIEKLKEYRRPLLDSEGKIRAWLSRVVSLRVITQEAFRLGYHKRPEVVDEVRRRLEIMVASKFDREEIFSTASPPDETVLRAFYEEDPTRFCEPEKAKVQEIFIRGDRKLAEKVAEEARNGADFEELARKYNQRSITIGKNGWLGYISADQYGPVGQWALKLQPGEIAGPIPVGNNYSIIRVVDRKSSYVPAFDEVKAKVKRAYLEERRNQLRSEWLQRLRETYPVVIYEDRVTRVCASGEEATE